MNSLPTLARWIAGLLAVSAVVFALAIMLERHAPSEVSGATTEATEGGSEAGEAAEHRETGGEGETLLGMNLESPWLVWGFVVVSFVLAAVVLRLWPPAFSMAVFLAGLAALLDLREAIGKFGTENLIAVLALTIGLAHVAAAILAIVAIRRFPGARIRPTPG